MPDDKLAAELAAIRERWSKVEYVGLKPGVVPEPGHQPSWLPDVQHLLAAAEAVIKPHQPGRIVLIGYLCDRHEAHRLFSITGQEAAGVEACQDCTASVNLTCAGCGPHMRLDSCPVRAAIERELTGGGTSDGC